MPSVSVAGRTLGGDEVARTRVAVIGAGYWAVTNHLPALSRRPDVNVVAIAGLGDGLGVVASRFGVPLATIDPLEAMDADCDAVVVASPNHLHHAHGMAALDRGKHLLIEKPIATRADDAWALTSAAHNAGVVALVPHGWNYKEYISPAAEWVADGLLGEIEGFSCIMASPTIGLFDGRSGYGTSEIAGQMLEALPATWADPSNGGGYAYGQLTHALGLLFWLTNLDPLDVTARTRSSETGVDVVNAAILTLSNGAIGTVSGCGHLPDGSRFQVDLRITGTQGTLLIDVERERCELRTRSGAVYATTPVAGDGDYVCEEPVDRWIDLIHGSSAANNSPLIVGARAVTTADALLTSARTKATIMAKNGGVL